MRFWEKIADLIFPAKCTTCGKLGAFVCQSCADKITPIKIQNCPVCNKISQGGKVCPRCRPKIEFSALLTSGYFKDEILKNAIHAYKYERLSAMAPLLADRLAQEIAKSKLRFDFIVPVPLSRERLAWRGFNQSELLAKELGRIINKNVIIKIKKIKNTKTQVGLTKKQRQENLRDAFVWKGDGEIKGKRVLLVDDVATTGATLGECAKVIKKAGAKSVSAVVVAKE